MTVRFNDQGARACRRSRILPQKPSAALRSQIPTQKRVVRNVTIVSNELSVLNTKSLLRFSLSFLSFCPSIFFLTKINISRSNESWILLIFSLKRFLKTFHFFVY